MDPKENRFIFEVGKKVVMDDKTYEVKQINLIQQGDDQKWEIKTKKTWR